MKALRIVYLLGLLFGFGIGIPVLSASAQTASPKGALPQLQGLRKLTGDDVRRAQELDKSVVTALKADRWSEAIAKAEELLDLRTRVQGPTHFETVDVEWLIKALRRIAPMPPGGRPFGNICRVAQAYSKEIFISTALIAICVARSGKSIPACARCFY